MGTTKKMNQKEKPQYDPSKPYKWDEDTVFELKGNEFGLLFNYFFSKYTESKAVVLAFEALQEKLKKAVEEGKAKQVDAAELQAQMQSK